MRRKYLKADLVHAFEKPLHKMPAALFAPAQEKGLGPIADRLMPTPSAGSG